MTEHGLPNLLSVQQGKEGNSSKTFQVPVEEDYDILLGSDDSFSSLDKNTMIK